MAVVEIQKHHGLIPLVLLATVMVNSWAGHQVDVARTTYNVQYPQMYAEQSDPNAVAFNCVQRAHQNTLENIPLFLALLVTSSIYRPLQAAIFGAIRVLGFIVYIHGYASGDPSNRLRGAFGYIGVLGALVLTVEASYKMLKNTKEKKI